MAGEGAFQTGAGSRFGPAPEAVVAMALRLDGMCQDMESVRMQLAQVAMVNWKSPAAAAFRAELAELEAALAAAIRAIERAVTEVGDYGRFLSNNSSNLITSTECLNPAFQLQPGPTFGGTAGGLYRW